MTIDKNICSRTLEDQSLLTHLDLHNYKVQVIISDLCGKQIIRSKNKDCFVELD